MNRRRFLLSSAILPLVAGRLAADVPSSSAPEPEKSRPSDPSDAPWMDRYQLTLNRVLHGTGPAYTPAFILEDIHATPGRRFTNYSGDVSGRWVGALAVASSVYGQRFPVLEQVVPRIIALQHPEGYFGKSFDADHPTDDDMALLWGNGRLLVGLMEYYALTHDPAVLASANRLGGFLVKIGPRFNSKQMSDEFSASHFASSYICWTQQTEGLAALYAVTKDRRYRDLCVAIAERIERRPGDHVHGYLCSVRGALSLYESTGEKPLLQQAEAAWFDITQSGDVLVTGGVPEAWSPKKKRTEGCAESDWLRLNLTLWRATGKPAYLEMAEHILFNEFAMNQFATGDFGHGHLDEHGAPDTVYVRAWWCCTLHGLRAFPDVHRSVFRQTAGEVFYDLPVDGVFEGSDLSARATSRLAEDGTIHIRIGKVSGEQKLTLRQPAWAAVQIARNGKPVRGLSVASLRPGDTLTATYAMKLNVRTAGESAELGKRKVFAYGPWLLGASAVANPGYFNELHAENLLLPESAHAAKDPVSSPFAVPVAAITLNCLPAEFPVQPETVHLRAIAEQTAQPVTQWELSFRVQA